MQTVIWFFNISEPTRHMLHNTNQHPFSLYSQFFSLHFGNLLSSLGQDLLFWQECSANPRLLQQLIIIYVLVYRNRNQRSGDAMRRRWQQRSHNQRKQRKNMFGSSSRITTGSFCSSREATARGTWSSRWSIERLMLTLAANSSSEWMISDKDIACVSVCLEIPVTLHPKLAVPKLFLC